MIYIFLDSNIFFDNYRLGSAEFALLAKFMQNPRFVLLMSEVVCSEVNNLHKREQARLLNDLKKNHKNIQRINENMVEFDFSVLDQPYEIRKLIQNKFKFVEFVPYDTIPQSQVVERAINHIFPFRKSEKGYRDTMIWLSVLQYMTSKKKEDSLFFVSKNTNDFYSSDKKNLHADLAKDIQSTGCELQLNLFPSLSLLFKDNPLIEEDQYSSDAIYAQYVDPNSNLIQDEIEWELELMLNEPFKLLLNRTGIAFPQIEALQNHSFEIVEGIEDGIVVDYNRLSIHEVYISLECNLRICIFDITVPSSAYTLHKTEIEKFYADITIEDDRVHLMYYGRPYITVSFVYNILEKDITGFQFVSFQMKYDRQRP